MTGTTLDAFDYVPRAVLEHVGHQLGMSAPELTTLRALYRRQMTLFLHQRWACEHAGFRRHDASAVLRLIEMRIAEIWSWAHAVARPEPRHHLPEEVACVLA
jgi:hypothetical protein